MKRIINCIKDCIMWDEHNGLPGKFVTIVFGIFLLFAFVVVTMVIWALIALIFSGFDSIGRPSYVGTAKIIDRSYTSESFTTVWISTGNGQGHTQVIYTPARYGVQLSLSNKTDWIYTSPGTYEKVTNGQSVNVEYRYGRYSNKIYIRKANFQ